MSDIKINSLYIYPIKSTAGIKLPHAKVEEMGLAFDRRFVVSDPSGQFITARTEPKLCLVQTQLTEQGITLSATNMPTLTLSYEKFSHQYQNVTVWDDEVAGQLCSKEANVWFSEYLKRPCQLLFFGSKSCRERKSVTLDEKNIKTRKVAFADGYPLLLISQASLGDLNLRLTSNTLGDNQQQGVSMAQFRPNIVVDNCLPFAEDGWQHIRIGDVEFKVSKPCERCIFTTINPQNAEKHPEQQPLRTLESFRQTSNGEVFFGQNLIPLNSGQIKAGDTLTILSKQKPPIFNNTETRDVKTVSKNNDKSIMSVNKKINIHFKKWNKTHQIKSLKNTSKTILEYGEEAGLILPYSCCAGMCGSCKAKLVSGEVELLSSDGLTAQEKQEGYILCCSAIATSDVIISHE